MPDLLIELFSEEIPARMQARAAADLKKRMTDGLVEAGLTYAAAHALSTPRRLTLAVDGLLAESPTLREERKGPKVGAPDKAVEGFLRGAGISRDQLEERETPKGAVYFATIENPVARRQRSSPRCWRRRSATSPGRNPCAGALVPCAGCVRCNRSSASCRMRAAPRWCRLKSKA